MATDFDLNYQSWSGMSSEQYGYGSMRAGFRNAVPSNVRFDGRASVQVWMGTPDSCMGFLEGQHKVLFTMWETDALPDKWIRFLGEYDQVIVPSKHNRGLFSEHHPNVKVVPLGVDQAVWVPVPREPNARFRFHAAGSLWSRKGMDIVLEAFLDLGLDAELHLKVAPHCQDMPKIASRHDIIVHWGWMSEQELVAWVRQADCWVAPSRGEGFGLMPLQAMACGVPTIMSDTSGHKEYQRFATSVVTVSQVPAPDGGSWDEPDLGELREAMRWVYENAPKARTDALSMQSLISHYSWHNASQRLLDALPVGHLLEGNPRIIPCEPMVLVTPNRKVSPHVAGVTYHLTKGEPQTVPDNVAEVLEQAGYLC